jgi:hypothetical protein
MIKFFFLFSSNFQAYFLLLNATVTYVSEFLIEEGTLCKLKKKKNLFKFFNKTFKIFKKKKK